MKNKITLLILINILLTGSVLAQCRIDSVLVFNYISHTNVKEPSYYTKSFYDSKDSLIGLLYRLWNNTINQYVNNSKEDYILNSNGKRTRIDSKTWMYNSWKNETQIDITLDGNGNESGYLYKSWDSASNSYLNNARYFIVFNTKKKPTQSLQQNWDMVNSVWVNRTKSDLTYETTGQFVINQLKSNWNKDSNKWINDLKIDYNLLPSGRTRSSVTSYWDCPVGCLWLFSDSTVYHYNQAGNDTLNQSYYQGKMRQKIESFYNADNCVQLWKYNLWNDQDNKFYVESEFQYTYRKNSSGLEAMVQKGLSIYPNPASDKLLIENASASTYEIRDILSGKRLSEGSIENGNAQIDVSAFSNGLYILTLGQTTFKLIINH